MRKTLLAVALLSAFGAASTRVLAADAPASPHTYSFNVGLASEYSYRGISQSSNDPAFSAGADYSHASGVYVGTWISTIKWLEAGGVYTDSQIEADFYGGIKKEVAPDLGIDVGFLRYQYPGDRVAGTTSPNTNEVYAALNYKTYGIKYSHSTSNLFGFADSKGSGYIDAYANVDLPVGGLQLNLHVGKQKVKNTSAADYTDYKVGVTKDFGFATGAVAYIKTTGNATDAAEGTAFEDWFKGRLVATVTKTF
jgi:uncharacterized protein (TIGR02001 family)